MIVFLYICNIYINIINCYSIKDVDKNGGGDIIKVSKILYEA